MSKEELIQELTNINSNFVNNINMKPELTSKHDKVCSELQECKGYNSHLLTRIIQLKRNALTNFQYSRQEKFMKMFWRKVFVKHCH